MSKLRPTTIIEILGILEDTYFTKNSFSVVNNPDNSPFLEITFTPKPEYSFEVVEVNDGEYITTESPGKYVDTGEDFGRSNFLNVTRAIGPWAKRIKEDLTFRSARDIDLEEFLESLREKFLTEGPEEDFTKDEIALLKKKLDDLQQAIEIQAEKLEATEKEIEKFKSEIENVKTDLDIMPKGVWQKVAGNKILKSVGSFVKTKEGRQLLSDGLKKFIE